MGYYLVLIPPGQVRRIWGNSTHIDVSNTKLYVMILSN